MTRHRRHRNPASPCAFDPLEPRTFLSVSFELVGIDHGAANLHLRHEAVAALDEAPFGQGRQAHQLPTGRSPARASQPRITR